MLCEINEAFIHNSCKKTAQLAKVIEVMNGKAFDYGIEMKNLNTVHNDEIQRIVNDFIDTSNKIYDDLVDFRKLIINNACDDYGNRYKKIKLDYSDLIRNAIEQYNNIRLQNKDLKQHMADLQQNINFSFSNFTEKQLKILESIKKQNDSCRRDITRSLIIREREYKDKENKIISQFKQDIAQITKENGDIINKLQQQIKKMVGIEILKRISEFNKYKTEIAEIKAITKQIRQEHTNVIKQFKNLQANFQFHRNNFLNEIKNAIKPINKDQQSVKRNMMLENKSHSLDIQIQTKKLNEKRNFHEKEIFQLQNQLNDIRQKQQISANSFESNQQKKSNMSESKRIALKQQYDETISTITMLNEEARSKINGYQLISDKIFKKIGSNTNDNLDIVLDQKESFISSLDSMENKFRKRYEAEEKGFKILITKKEEQFKNFVANQIITINKNIKKQKELNEISIKMIRQQDSQNKLARDKMESQDTNIKELLVKNEPEMEERRKNLENKIKIFKSELENKAILVKNHFDSDLNEKVTSIKEKNRIELENLEFNFDSELNSHKNNVSRIAKLLNDEIAKVDQSKTFASRKIEALDSQISKITKEIRKLNRQKISEENDITNSFQMQIQVEQVPLNTKIDQLSKLYTDEENLKGIEIIDSIRKLRMTQNKNRDIINNHEKELQDLKTKFSQEIQKMKENLEKIKGNYFENELIEKLKDKEKEAELKIKNYEEETENILNSLKSKIETTKIQIEEQKKQITDQIEQYSKPIDPFVLEKPDNSEILEKISSKKEEIIKEFNVKKQYVEKQLEITQNEQNELISNLNQLFDKEQQKISDELKEMDTEISKNLVPVKENAKNNILEIDSRISAADTKELDYIMRLFDPQTRIEEKLQISAEKTKSNEKLEKITEEFISFIDFLSDDKPKKIVEPPPSTRVTSSRRRKSHSSK
ncbi:hypothetical protein TVAG_158180 [Trichomonas vaginalis G3]|uniref:Uncharacterized protein n=1 Tax=Trichomonas vaginalis (strain ATCC PRA-98 / G3) TaxID=412133 RepID=A2F9R6_TRIV3|nr:biological adhesion protein [Trichomonas vaginalis G3]EAX98358.1 hypothetical protein TVAG_158180 [Trichomonas vaginalis G3]KAI5495220.1 biological adhesion protein [Trichomonas vaginalis G3]|eukprot:XP_001311288.1 hypothetical protein [Trichomonas vaginalis G3]